MPTITNLFSVTPAINATNNSENVPNGTIIKFNGLNSEEEVVTAFANVFGYIPDTDMGANQHDFFNKHIADYILRVLNRYVVSSTEDPSVLGEENQF